MFLITFWRILTCFSSFLVHLLVFYEYFMRICKNMCEFNPKNHYYFNDSLHFFKSYKIKSERSRTFSTTDGNLDLYWIYKGNHWLSTKSFVVLQWSNFTLKNKKNKNKKKLRVSNPRWIFVFYDCFWQQLKNLRCREGF